MSHTLDKAVACKINKLEVTSDTLTGRGGLTFFVKYIQAIGIVSLLLRQFAGIKKTVKGVASENLFLQVLYFFLDRTSRHLCHFDNLHRDQGYRAVIEMPEKQMASSHAVKRFFRAFNIFHAAAFRWVLKELFVWRLRRTQPRQVILTLDTMCMEGKIVDAIFRRGKRHSNYGNDVAKMIRGIVSRIRSRYDARAVIIVRVDAGFFDEKNFTLFDELAIGFIATGKMYDTVKEKVAAIPEKKWEEYDNGCMQTGKDGSTLPGPTTSS